MKTQPKNNSLWFIFICILSLISAAQAWPATYYVDVNTGSDNNDGSSSDMAWRTIEHAVSQLDTSGDVLNVAPGTYTPIDIDSDNSAIDVALDGVTIQGAQGAIIDGGGGTGVGVRMLTEWVRSRSE